MVMKAEVGIIRRDHLPARLNYQEAFEDPQVVSIISDKITYKAPGVMIRSKEITNRRVHHGQATSQCSGLGIPCPSLFTFY